jgi:hypothetical protein
MKFHFLTFGGGGQNYHEAVLRIARQAYASKWFDGVYGLTDNDLFLIDDKWTSTHRRFIETNQRGYGYWLWKPFLLLQLMRQIEYGDIIFYADAGTELNIKGGSRFSELRGMASCSDLVVFEIGERTATWTKGDLFHAFGLTLNDPIAEEGQIIGGVGFFRKTRTTLSLLHYWKLVCESDDYHLLDDTPSRLPNDPAFRENRHDQAIFSLIVKMSGQATILPDETFYSDLWQAGTHHETAPIQTMRNKTGLMRIPF